MTAVVRYLLADVLKTQRWAAPVVAYLAVMLIIGPPTGAVLPTYAMAAAALVPIAMWVTVTVFHSEEPAQAAITMSITGFQRAWLGKFLAALSAAGVLSFASLAWITLTSGQFSQFGVGIVAYAMTTLTGVAFGTLISRPVLPKIAWTMLIGVAFSLAQLLIRHMPPVNALIDLYAADRPGAFTDLLIIAAESVVLSALIIAAAHAVAKRRV